MLSDQQIFEYLKDYTLNEENQPTVVKITGTGCLCCDDNPYKLFVNEFWTARQRQASSIQEISYRACFKPQLPRFFINLLTKKGQVVYDPFCGRGTTLIEAALMERKVIGNDINPLSKILCLPRLSPPDIDAIQKRLSAIPFNTTNYNKPDLSMFFHPKTEQELLSLKYYLISRREEGSEDYLDRWIRMIATNRLTGHSKGFFSVYTMPPNQAVSAARQLKINERLKQKPEYRDVAALIIKKSKHLLRNLTHGQIKLLQAGAKDVLFFEEDAAETKLIAPESVDLTVTSPPFLNVVQYTDDNWLRLWFNGIERHEVERKMTLPAKIPEWERKMNLVFRELFRITRPEGWVAFEVGEIRRGKIKLEEIIIPLATANGFTCFGTVINKQHFTKTSNIWGVKNNHSGTNSNRVVMLKKPGLIPCRNH